MRIVSSADIQAIPTYGFFCAQRLPSVHDRKTEKRFYCISSAGGGILTVRFTYRRNVIRIIGAGYWRKGKAIYEKENRLHG